MGITLVALVTFLWMAAVVAEKPVMGATEVIMCILFLIVTIIIIIVNNFLIIFINNN